MTTRSSIVRSRDGIIYFNLKIDNIYNNVPLTQGYGIATDKKGQIRLKTGEILSKQSDYDMAIDFFNCSSISIPLTFVEILEGNNDDINATQYGFCLKHLGSNTLYSQRVIYEPDVNATVYASRPPFSPLNNNGLQDFDTVPYYYAVYSFHHLLGLFNNALYTCWSAMNVAFPASSPPCPPYWVYDEPSGRICLILHETYVRSPLAEVFWNSQTEKYIEGIRIAPQPNYFTGDQINFTEFKLKPDLARPYPFGTFGAAFGLPSQSDIITAPVIGDKPFLPWKDLTTLGPSEFYIMMQEYDSLYFWCNIKSIVFFTSAIQIADEYLPLTNNPNLINSTPVVNMTIASPSVVTTQGSHGLFEGQTVYITKGSYSVNGVPITTVTQYRAVQLTDTTFQLYNVNGTPTNVTAFNPAVAMWEYATVNANVGQFNNPSRSILAYFDVIAQRGVDWRTNAFSNPAYRKFHQMVSDGPLNELDLQIYLQLNSGALVPYTVGINDSMDMKFCFRRRGYKDV